MSVFASIARNKRKTLALALYGLATVLIVGWRASQYSDLPWLVAVARGSAAGIYLNFALVLLPMMRFLLSRRILDGLRVLLPFHKAVEAHVIAGTAVLAFSVVHVAAYIGLIARNLDVVRPLLTAPVVFTGVLLVGLLALLGVGAWMRGRGRFEVFYYTHFLTIPIGLASIVHAPWFLVLCAAPLLAFLIDRVLRLAFMTRAATVERIQVDGRDLDLVVHRPDHFTYQAGDYAFLCVPDISRLQWHPFSLINATSDGGSLSFRIRRYGSWTNALAEVPVGTLIYVDGPFASPCRDLHTFDRIIVVAAGIGITPFVSFLEEVRANGLYRFDRMAVYWLERDEASFSRFAPLLEQLATQIDPLTVQLVTRRPNETPGPLVRVGRVDWDAELQELARGDLAGATVFFCGPKTLSHAIRVSSRKVALHFRTESF